jgi:hypothetical protein
LSKILDLDDKKLRKCLEATSTLQRTGVVDFNYWGSGTLLSRLSTLEALSLNILKSKIDMTVFDDDFKKTAKSVAGDFFMRVVAGKLMLLLIS